MASPTTHLSRDDRRHGDVRTPGPTAMNLPPTTEASATADGFVSIDGVKGAFQAMMAGKLNVSVECSPLLGPQLMTAVKDILAGKPVPKRILTEEGIFPMETAAAEFPKRKY